MNRRNPVFRCKTQNRRHVVVCGTSYDEFFGRYSCHLRSLEHIMFPLAQIQSTKCFKLSWFSNNFFPWNKAKNAGHSRKNEGIWVRRPNVGFPTRWRNWAMRKVERTKIDAFGMQCWRRLIRVSRMERKTNCSVWELQNIKPEMRMGTGIKGYKLQRQR